MPSISKTLRNIADASAISPKNLIPPHNRKIIGREEVLEQISKKVLTPSPEGNRILLHGAPGVGKSACALDIAHKAHRLNYHSVIIWISCQKTVIHNNIIVNSSDYAKNIYDVINKICFTIGAEAITRKIKQDRISLLGTQLINYRTLLIIDSVDELEYEEKTHFFNSLPITVDVIGTSRERFEWNTSIEVKPFGFNDTHIAQILDNEIAKSDVVTPSSDKIQLIKLSKGVPQSLLWMFGLYKAGIQISEICNMLNEGSILMKYYFEKQWNMICLDTSTQKLAMLLALAQNISLNDLNVIAHEMQVAIEKLNLLETINFVYRHNNTVFIDASASEYVISKTRNQKEFESLLYSWSQYLLKRLVSANSKKYWHQVFSDIDNLHNYLITTWRWLDSIGKGNISAETVKKQILSNSCYYLYSRGLWDELQNMSDDIDFNLANYQEFKLYSEVILTWVFRIVRYRSGSDESGRFFAEKMHPIAESDFANNAIRDILSIGLHKCQWSADYKENMLVNVKHLISESEYEWACRALLQIGNEYSKANDFEKAKKAFEWLEQEADKHSNCPWANEMKAFAHGNIGILYNKQNKWKLASKRLAASIPGLGQKYDFAVANFELSYSLHKRKRYLSSKKYQKIALAAKRELGLRSLVMESNEAWEKKVEGTLEGA